MTNPLVSIVICCHNRAHLLPETMASVFAQAYEPVEIVVVDDGSTDDTLELMARYGEKVRYYWQTNRGVALTRTTGCQLAKGDYIAFQDDDDLMPTDRIVTLYEAFKKHPSTSFAVGDWAAIDHNGNLTGERWLRESAATQEDAIVFHDGYEAVLWPKIPATPHTTLFRRVDGERIGWFDNRFMNASEDKDFFARLAQLGPVVYVPKIVSYYRRGHGDSLTSESGKAAYSHFLLLEKHLMSLSKEQKEIRGRLQVRMLIALKKIAHYESKFKRLPDAVPNDYLERGLSFIGSRNRLLYYCFGLITLPMRRAIRGLLTWNRVD